MNHRFFYSQDTWLCLICCRSIKIIWSNYRNFLSTLLVKCHFIYVVTERHILISMFFSWLIQCRACVCQKQWGQCWKNRLTIKTAVCSLSEIYSDAGKVFMYDGGLGCIVHLLWISLVTTWQQPDPTTALKCFYTISPKVELGPNNLEWCSGKFF